MSDSQPSEAPSAPTASGRAAVPIPPTILSRYNGRVLDPAKAAASGGRSFGATAYVGDELLIQGDASAVDALIDAAHKTGHQVISQSADPSSYLDELADEAVAQLQGTWVRKVKLRNDPRKGTPPDAWSVLQHYREVARDSGAGMSVGLNHLIHLTDAAETSPSHLRWEPLLQWEPSLRWEPSLQWEPVLRWEPSYFSGNPLYSAAAQQQSMGGRLPVAGPLTPPAGDPDLDPRARRPVVAILDTGLGTHPWFADNVTRGASVKGYPIGLTDKDPDPEVTPILDDPLAVALDREAGHGTFIAGLVRQACPDAHLLSVRVIPGLGVVDEHKVTTALNMLLVRQVLAQHGLLSDADGGAGPARLIDVLLLSLGYYIEDDDDTRYTSALARTLKQYGRLGIPVVTASGNDGTSAPMYPAALAPRSPDALERDSVPVVTVGASNPNGSPALFSNTGSWVSCSRPGVNVVSTIPTNFNGGYAAVRSLPDGRSDLDPDDFSGGFAIWSGTSFAAPALAGELAQSMLDQGGLDDATSDAATTRAWLAIESTDLGWSRP